VDLSIFLLRSATSGLIILGMVKVVDHKHQTIRQSLDQAMEQLTAANLELDRLAGIDPLANLARRALHPEYRLGHCEADAKTQAEYVAPYSRPSAISRYTKWPQPGFPLVSSR